MKNELKNTTLAAPVAITNNQPARRRILRQFDPNHPLAHHPSILLGHENPESFQFVRQSVNDEFNPKSNYQQIISEIAAQNVWRSLRTAAVESAHFDMEIANQAPQVDRIYEEIDSNCRTALALRDNAFAQTKRHIKDDESVYTRRFLLMTSHLNRGKVQ